MESNGASELSLAAIKLAPALGPLSSDSDL